MNYLIYIVAIPILIAYAITQVIAAYLGIEYLTNEYVALVVLFLSFVFRFPLIMTIAAFFGAAYVWEWHWALALVFAAPGVLLVVPSVLGAIINIFPRGLAKRDRISSPKPLEVPLRTEKDTKLTGVGGWLLLLVIGLIFLGPLMTYGSTSMRFSSVESEFPELSNIPNWVSYKSIMWTVTWGYIVASIFAGYLLLKKHTESTVSLVIGFLWVGSPIVMMTDVFSAITYLRLDASLATSPEVIAAIIQWAIIAAIWTLYLKRSRRIKNTYK